MKQFVIIGNGTAAVGCIEGIRKTDRESRITVISSEPYPVYGRPLISYYLQGKTDLERMRYRPADFYERNGCRVLYGKTAVQLKPEQKTVLLENGDEISYDAVCVAAGSSPFIPPLNGLNRVEQKFTFQTLSDTLALEKAVTEQSRVLIVGAGLIGLKCAEGLTGRCESITVCDLADRVLSSILDADCAALMQRKAEENGVHFLLRDSVEEFSPGVAHMKSGSAVEFDVLVLAVGVRANTALIQEAGGSCGRGISVDERQRTTLPSVYAAGDCTECQDISCGETKVLALLPNAYFQGECAGRNMAGEEAAFTQAIPMNSLGLFGLHAMSAGTCGRAEDGYEVYEEKGEGRLKRLFTKNGKLTGYLLIGAVERAGIYTGLIRSGGSLSEVDFELLKKVPNLFAFGTEYRSKKFGGVV